MKFLAIGKNCFRNDVRQVRMKIKDLRNRSHIDKKTLIRRTGELAEKIQEVPQASWTANKKWYCL